MAGSGVVADFLRDVLEVGDPAGAMHKAFIEMKKIALELLNA